MIEPDKKPELPKAPDAPPVEYPTSIKLLCPYGYFDEDDAGLLHLWSAGQVVTDPTEIKLLVDRDVEHVAE